MNVKLKDVVKSIINIDHKNLNINGIYYGTGLKDVEKIVIYFNEDKKEVKKWINIVNVDILRMIVIVVEKIKYVQCVINQRR